MNLTTDSLSKSPISSISVASDGPEAAAPVQRRDPLSIVHTVSTLNFGGMEQFAVRLAATQAASGHRVSIMSLREGPLQDTAHAANLPVHIAASHNALGRLMRAMSIFARQKPDIVHVHNTTTLHYAVTSKWMARPKLVLTDHGQCAGIPRVPSSWEVKRTDAFVSVSGDVARRNTEALPGVRNPLVIHNGVDFAPARRSRADVLAELQLLPGLTGIVVARMHTIKDHETLLRALGLLARSGLRDVNLLILGDGDERNRLQALVPELGLDTRRIRFLGFRTDVPDLLAASDFFTLSSLQEGLPLSMLEAMAHALPVVATSVGGVPELITEGEHGYLVPVKRPDLLADRLGRILTDTELRRRMGIAAKRTVDERFTFAKMALRYEDLYYSLNPKTR